MSLHKTDIPPAVLADWYGNHLVITKDFHVSVSHPAEAGMPTQKEVTQTTPAPTDQLPQMQVAYLGRYAKKIVWMVHDPVNKYTGDAEFNLLTSILNACKMSMEDIALVNVASGDISFAQIQQQLLPHTLVALGVDTSFFPVPAPPFSLLTIEGTTVITGEGLATLLGNREYKAKLWQLLKNHFRL